MGLAVGVTAYFSQGAGEVWWAAKRGKKRHSGARPAKFGGQSVKQAQRVNIKEIRPVQARAGKHAVVERQFHNIHESGFARDLEHAPVPEHVADVGAGFVVRSEVRQLIVSAISLMDARDGFLVLGAVGRSAVVKRAAPAGDVHLLLDEVGPDAFQRRPERAVARLDEQIRCAGIKIIGADGVAHAVGLLLEGDAVLVVIGAVGHEVAHRHELPGQFQIARLAGGAIKLHHAHVVRRADGIARQLGRWLAKGVVEKVRRLAGHGQQVGAAGGPVMHAGGG